MAHFGREGDSGVMLRTGALAQHNVVPAVTTCAPPLCYQHTRSHTHTHTHTHSHTHTHTHTAHTPN
jgi:hypothetical protein